MSSYPRSSHRRYLEYVKARREAARKKKPPVESEAPDQLTSDENYRKKAARQRSFWSLFREFWALLQGRRALVFAALFTLTISAVMVPIVPACTKIAFDYIIAKEPGP